MMMVLLFEFSSYLIENFHYGIVQFFSFCDSPSADLASVVEGRNDGTYVHIRTDICMYTTGTGSVIGCIARTIEREGKRTGQTERRGLYYLSRSKKRLACGPGTLWMRISSRCRVKYTYFVGY